MRNLLAVAVLATATACGASSSQVVTPAGGAVSGDMCKQMVDHAHEVVVQYLPYSMPERPTKEVTRAGEVRAELRAKCADGSVDRAVYDCSMKADDTRKLFACDPQSPWKGVMPADR
jgi:hypothetical protein